MQWPPQLTHHKKAGTVRLVELLLLWVRCAVQCPFDILMLPHSARGPQQLLLSMTYYYAASWLPLIQVNSSNFVALFLQWINIKKSNSNYPWEYVSNLWYLLTCWVVGVSDTHFAAVQPSPSAQQPSASGDSSLPVMSLPVWVAAEIVESCFCFPPGVAPGQQEPLSQVQCVSGKG